MQGLACSAQTAQAVQDLVGDPVLAARVCSGSNVTETDPLRAVVQYLVRNGAQAVSPAEPSGTSHGLDAAFLLFSGYLVFLMQAGFAMVSSPATRLVSGAVDLRRSAHAPRNGAHGRMCPLLILMPSAMQC